MRHSPRASAKHFLNVSRMLARLVSSVVPSTILSIAVLAMLSAPGFVSAQGASVGNSATVQVTKVVGTIKKIEPDSIAITAESGSEVTAKLSQSTKILRVPPGEKDLKNAVALQAQDLQAGDRVLVRGQASADGRTIAALAVIVMKQSDVAAKKQQERDDWQNRGVGGLVTAVDTATNTITISSSG